MSDWTLPNRRTYGRDGDTYGRHALREPGGDNRQIDVLHIINPPERDRYRIHPTRFDPDYIGRHMRTPGLLPKPWTVRLSQDTPFYRIARRLADDC